MKFVLIALLGFGSAGALACDETASIPGQWSDARFWDMSCRSQDGKAIALSAAHTWAGCRETQTVKVDLGSKLVAAFSRGAWNEDGVTSDLILSKSNGEKLSFRLAKERGAVRAELALVRRPKMSYQLELPDLSSSDPKAKKLETFSVYTGTLKFLRNGRKNSSQIVCRQLPNAQLYRL